MPWLSPDFPEKDSTRPVEPGGIHRVLIGLIRDLRDVGTGVIGHLMEGRCPDPDDTRHPPTDRDEACPACRVLRRADAMLGDGGWR